VGDLGELTTLISVQVDVVYVERSSDQVGGVDTITDGVNVGELRGDVPHEVLEVVELEVDTDFVVLERDQRESKTRVAAEPELERDVEGVLGGAAEELARGVGLTTSAVIVAILTALNDQVGELGDVTNHLGVTGLLTRLLGEFIPDVEPITVVLVNALTTDLEFNVVDQVVTNPVEPAELGTRTVRGLELHGREGGLEVDAVDQVAVTADRACNTLAEVGSAVEGLLN
jgi:hypothetical protein